ncbi:MAG TPA: hypothetical protein PKM88_07405 [bacterium]|nr:hypothetical protein [bacterium]
MNTPRAALPLPALLALALFTAGLARVAWAGRLTRYVAPRFVLPIEVALAGAGVVLLLVLAALLARRVRLQWQERGMALLVLLAAAAVWWRPLPSLAELMAFKDMPLGGVRAGQGKLPPAPVDADGYRECDGQRVYVELDALNDTQIAAHSYRLSLVGQLTVLPGADAIDLPPGALVMARLVMVCCAADAQPVYMAVANRAGFDETRIDDWVRVRGTVSFRPLPDDSGWYAWLEDDEITAIAPPEPEYLQPQLIDLSAVPLSR